MPTRGTVVVIIVVLMAAGAGLAAYELYHVSSSSSISRAGTDSSVILDKRASLNETYDQYNPYDPYPFESVSGDMQLSSGTYRVTVHTTGTVYVYVKLDGCYDETLYHCTRLQEGFTSSENPPNVATFTVTQNGGYTLTISLQQFGTLREACGLNYGPTCPTADLDLIVTRI